MMMMMIMIAGLVDSIRTPIKCLLSRSDEKQDKSAKMMRVVIKDTDSSCCSSSECIVCLCEVELGERFAILDTCKHGFHVECVEAWLKHQPNCPLCRTPVFIGANQQQQQQQETRRVLLVIYLTRFAEMSRWCGHRALETLATWLTKSFSQGLQSTLSESCSNYL